MRERAKSGARTKKKARGGRGEAEKEMDRQPMLKNLRGRWRPPPLAFFCPRPTFRRSLISRGSILDRISWRKRGDYSQSRTGCKTNSLRNSGRPFELSGKNLNLVSCSHELRVLSSKSKLWKHISLTMYRNRAI